MIYGSHLQVVIDTGILSDVLPSLLMRSKTSIVKVACKLVSNVLAGPSYQIQAVIDAGLLKQIFNALMQGDSRVQLEASYAVANLIHGRNWVVWYAEAWDESREFRWELLPNPHEHQHRGRTGGDLLLAEPPQHRYRVQHAGGAL
jgi:hypothetical protein